MSPSASRTPSRRALAVAAVLALLVAVPLVLLAGAPADEGPETVAAAPASDAESLERRVAVAPAELPPLLFASNREGDYRLYAAEPDGSDIVAVSEELATFPAWSQDGARIAYVGEAAGFTARRAALVVVEADGAVRDVVAGPQVPSRPAFRDRAGELWFQSSLQGSNGAAGVSERATIDAVDLEEGRPRTMLDRRGAIYQPAWSPDGSRLAVVLGDPGCRAGQRCRQTLAVSGGADDGARDGEARGSGGDGDAARDGGGEGLTLRTLIATGAPATPAWSPDGKRIAYTRDGGDGPQIWIAEVADGSTRQVTTGAQPAAEPTWSPDGEALAFSRGCEIFVQRIGSSSATNVTRTRACEISPAWRPETRR